MLFSPLPDNMEGAENASGKQVKVLIVPCSCVWAVREIREPLLSRPVWPGDKSELLRRQDPGNTQSALSFPDGRRLLSLPGSELSDRPSQLSPARPCKPAQGARREERERLCLQLLRAPTALRGLCRAVCTGLSAAGGMIIS